MIAAAPAAPAPPPVQALVTLAPDVPGSVLGRGAVRLDAGSRTWIVRLGARTTLASLGRLPGVSAVEADRERTPDAGPDPLLPAQGYLRQIGWTRPTGRRRPLVALLDTGVDGRAPDLRGQLAPGARSFVDDNPLTDQSGHGTHVAGLIAAAGRDGTGIAGVADARLLVVKIADRQGRATTATLVQGIRYAIARHARVINVSFGGDGFSALEQRAILDARRAGILVVAAAGNAGRAGNPRQYPGAYRHVLTVAAVRDDGTPLAVSTRGPQVAIAAPGRRLLSLRPGGGYSRRTGTSMATGLVTGAAARLFAERPGVTVSQVWSLLVGSARDAGPPGRDDATGWGVLDLAGALAAPAPEADGPEPDDDAADARRTPPLLDGAGAAEATVAATVEQWADARDDFRVALAAGDRLDLDVQGPPGSDLDLILWRPGAPAFTPGAAYTTRWLAAASVGPGTAETLSHTAASPGTYTVEVRAASGRGRYSLTARRTPASPPA